MKIIFIISIILSIIFGFSSLLILILLRSNKIKNKYIFLILIALTILSITIFMISRNFYRPFWS